MSSKFIGCHGDLENLKVLHDKLNAEVLERVNETQELVLINNFVQESNEFQFKKCLEERIADIDSWRWVLEDLSKRLCEAISSLRYEHKAIRVVLRRIQDELNGKSREGARPGALCPMTDAVEDAIHQEYNFLREQKKKFEKILLELEKQSAGLIETKSKIEIDVLNKQEAIQREESCASINSNSFTKVKGNLKKKKKRCSPLARWEKRCASLKLAGLRGLGNAIIVRQKIRGARVYLSITAQANTTKVDSAIRRRHHANTAKLQELDWQKQETLRNLKALDEELITTEQSLLDNMEQEKVIEARLADRTLRPAREQTRDNVDRKLRDELARLRHFAKDFRSNIDRIKSLQNTLTDTSVQIDRFIEDLSQIVQLDEDRIRLRLGEEFEDSPPAATSTSSSHLLCSGGPDMSLRTIKEEEEDEDDDYPIFVERREGPSF